jgi:DNA-binding NarL/FixJ family response regulator
MSWRRATAELRILLYLPTHLSFREIGERTFVSANTVKTQANGVYRKLGVRPPAWAPRSLTREGSPLPVCCQADARIG